MVKKRYLINPILNDLSEKMVFIGGPRQVGKTTLSCNLIGETVKNYSYYNWDNRDDRKEILSYRWPGDAKLLIFDEIHKYAKWKSLIKGIYDKQKEMYQFIVTGSARLDIYRKGGDSLQGRYHYYRLHPFSLAEIIDTNNKVAVLKEPIINNNSYQTQLDSLIRFGGFPEPFIKQSMRSLRRWHNEKIERLFREDIRDVNLIHNIDSMRLLSDFLPSKVGGLLSLNSLREDIEVSHRALSSWMNILETFYYCFRIYPYTTNKFRSLKKEPKLYLYDWSEVENEAARYENIVASHLLKLVHFLYDYEGHKTVLHFIRDTTKREVDFLITVNNKPWFAVEVKTSDTSPSKSLLYFKEKLSIPYSYQIVFLPDINIRNQGIHILSADKFLSSLI